MEPFTYRDGELFCENVRVSDIVEKVGTPCYVYSYSALKYNFSEFDESFKSIDHITCYSVKANSNIAILNIFKSFGSGFDIVSGGELYRLEKIGADFKRVVFSGVGKTEEEIEYALTKGILMFNVESFDELYTIDKVSERTGKRAKVSLRVNPDVDPKTHPYISTGLKENKFGVGVDEAVLWYREALSLENVEVVGIDCHIGSQLTDVSPFVDAVKRVKVLIEKLKKEGIALKYFDIGGGLGVRYKDETPPSFKEYASSIIEEVKDLGLTMIFEPGRCMVANAGILVSKVLYFKKNGDKNFVIIDAAMNDLVRPSLYKAYQEIIPVSKKDTSKIKADVVGPICESGDYMAKDREIEVGDRGSFIAIKGAGAYGFTMSSNYNSRRRCPEVLVKDDRFFVIREREEYEDLVRREKLVEEL